jgi:hypothetical protein
MRVVLGPRSALTKAEAEDVLRTILRGGPWREDKGQGRTLFSTLLTFAEAAEVYLKLKSGDWGKQDAKCNAGRCGHESDYRLICNRLKLT